MAELVHTGFEGGRSRRRAGSASDAELIEDGGRTWLALTQERFRNAEAADRHRDGSTNKLDRIEQYLQEE